jgi:hypothetical protein
VAVSVHLLHHTFGEVTSIHCFPTAATSSSASASASRHAGYFHG